jgi:hypothetical protein
MRSWGEVLARRPQCLSVFNLTQGPNAGPELMGPLDQREVRDAR